MFLGTHSVGRGERGGVSLREWIFPYQPLGEKEQEMRSRQAGLWPW